MSSMANGSASATDNSATASGVSIPKRPVIEFNNLVRRFGSTLAVDDVTFSVEEGEVFGYIGPNGAGKTTSMKILATLDVPDSGTAFVDGFSVIDDPDKARRRLGFMPDGFGTYVNVTCEEYLDFFARSYGLRGNERLEALRYVMGFTQLDRLAQKPVDGLSKGMKQRLCLGRALIHDPKVLILDEPAAGLDPRARIELREMITALAGEGKALLVSSHILTELAEMCDRVGIIERGQLLAVGSVEEILHYQPDSDGAGSDAAESPANAVGNISVTVLDDVEPVKAWLAQKLPDTTIKRVGKTLSFVFSGTPTDQAELLTAMINQNFRITDFVGKQRSLEDAFLHVTKGRVQ